MRKKKSRREYGSGSISINNAIKRYTVIWTDSSGKKHTKSTFELSPVGRKQAEAYLRQINDDLAAGVSVTDAAPLQSWIDDKIETESVNVRPSTTGNWKNALGMVKKHNPALLGLPINEVSAAMVQRLYGTLAAAGYKPATIKRVHILLYSTFKRAYRARVLRYNIMVEVKTPTIKNPDIVTFSWREIGKVFLYLHRQKKKSGRMTRDYILLYRLLCGTGMRIGELLALQWRDIDLERREIHVHQTISHSNQEIQPPKTAAGDRLIPILSNKTLRLLTEARETAANGLQWVFHTEKGNRIPYPMIHRHWVILRREIGIGEKSLHCWRHTYATNMLLRGFPVTEISRILGHSSPRMTYEVYSHSIPSYNQTMIALYNQQYRL